MPNSEKKVQYRTSYARHKSRLSRSQIVGIVLFAAVVAAMAVLFGLLLYMG